MLTLFSHSNSDHMVRKASSFIQEPSILQQGCKKGMKGKKSMKSTHVDFADC